MLKNAGMRSALGSCGLVLLVACAAGPARERGPLRAVLIDAAEAQPARIAAITAQGERCVLLRLDESARNLAAAVGAVRAHGCQVGYWLEVGRSPTLAESHPELVAPLEGHEGWRHAYPTVPVPGPGEIVRAFPWVPISCKEAWLLQLTRTAALLAEAPPVDHVFLNDLQDAPSSCGCGNLLCRWTPLARKTRVGTPLPRNYAAEFAASVRRIARGARVVAVLASECESTDQSGPCGGVDCAASPCWQQLAIAWGAVAADPEPIGLLALARTFRKPADWPSDRVAWLRGWSLAKGHAERPLLPVLQAWGGDEAHARREAEACLRSGAAGYVLALDPVEQSITPRVVRAGG